MNKLIGILVLCVLICVSCQPDQSNIDEQLSDCFDSKYEMFVGTIDTTIQLEDSFIPTMLKAESLLIEEGLLSDRTKQDYQNYYDSVYANDKYAGIDIISGSEEQAITENLRGVPNWPIPYACISEYLQEINADSLDTGNVYVRLYTEIKVDIRVGGASSKKAMLASVSEDEFSRPVIRSHFLVLALMGIRYKGSLLYDTSSGELAQEIQNLEIDSLNGKPIGYYLNHELIYPPSLELYNGEFTLSDDSVTFTLLDSITSPSGELTPFYKYLLDYICSVSDGALSEVLGGYVWGAIENNPKYYVENGLEGLMEHVGFAMSFDENWKVEFNKLDKLLKENTNPERLQYVDSTMNDLKEFIIENLEE